MFLHNKLLEMKGNIRVFCRMRPSNSEEQKDGCPIEAFEAKDEATQEEGILKGVKLAFTGARSGRAESHEFKVDRVFPPVTTQAEVFSEISQLVQSALDGYKVCVFAYGQTGSGKTHTMIGGKDEDTMGIIPRSVAQIFKAADGLKKRGWDFEIEASFLEVYNETVRDLLGGKSDLKHEIKHDQAGRTTVTNLKSFKVQRPEQVHELINKADSNRSIGQTSMNERSSRSHSVFTMHLRGSNASTGQTNEGTLNLIDLAGSERLNNSKATGDRLKETQAINKSLSALGDVITALAKEETGGHIPYRNSKLTYLLQNSLGGDAKTLMFANVSPAMASAGETLCTMRFATKVNSCVNEATQH
jgi:kinesin family protein C1